MILRWQQIRGKVKKRGHMNRAQIQVFHNRHIRTSTGQAHLTFQEIADMLNLLIERVRKIEAKALLKLKITQVN